MRNFSAFILLVIISLNLNAQNRILPIKENFDYLGSNVSSFNSNYFGPSTTFNCNTEPANLGGRIGDGTSYVLESYIKMYEATGDKAYLIKLVTYSYYIQWTLRLDQCDASNHPGWSNKMYHDGLIIWPMSHFVHLVYNDITLFNTPLPSASELGLTGVNASFYPTGYTTYGSYANWLRQRCEQTLDWYTYGNAANNYENYWGGDDRCYLKSPNASSPAEVNFQGGFANALFYLGLVDPNTDYLHKAAVIAQAYFGIVIDGGTPCFQIPLDPDHHWHNGPIPQLRIVTEPIANGSYIWKHYGWRPEECSDRNGIEPNDYEDLAHGVQSLNFPTTIANRLSSGGVMLFDDSDMEKYSNTFALNVFDSYSGTTPHLTPHLHAGIDGDDVIAYRGVTHNFDYNGLDNTTMLNAALVWMRLAKFNNIAAPNDVYSIIMNLYENQFHNNNVAVSNTIGYYGLSEVISEQWARECVNLNLYNRIVVYNQDFTIKNKLKVVPQEFDNYHQSSGLSFADPVNTNNSFILAPNINCKMIAGESIDIGPGFDSGGANWDARIDPNLCSDGYRVGHTASANSTPNNRKNIIQQNVSAQKIESIDNKSLNQNLTSFQIAPNPNNGQFVLSYDSGENTNITIIDVLGKTVYQSQNVKLNGNINIDLSQQPKGVYTICLNSNSGLQTKRIIIQ